MAHLKSIQDMVSKLLPSNNKIIGILFLLGPISAFAIENSKNDFQFNGFVAGTLTNSKNEILYPSFESGISASYAISNSLSFHSSVNVRDNVRKIDTLFFEYEFPIHDMMNVNIQVGKNKSYLGLSNYARFYPPSRTFIVMPQSIYWNTMDELVGSSNGVKISLKHDSGIALQFGKSKNDIHNSQPINESTFVPGKISKSENTFYGITYTSNSLYMGAQRIRFQLTSSGIGNGDPIFDRPFLDMNLIFAKYIFGDNEISAEHMMSGSSLNSLDGNSKHQSSFAFTLSHRVNDRIKINVAYDKTSYNHKSELQNFPNKNSTTEKIIGVTFKNFASNNVTFKIEHHFVNGISWLSSEGNENGFKSPWDFSMCQVIYEF